MKVLVTGGAGFLGVHVVDQLLHCPKVASVTVLDYCARTAAPQALSPSYRVTFIRASMLDADLLADLLADCDAVIHLAAETFVDAIPDRDAARDGNWKHRHDTDSTSAGPIGHRYRSVPRNLLCGKLDGFM